MTCGSTYCRGRPVGFAVMAKLTEFDSLPPLSTLTLPVPTNATSDADSAAVSCVLLTKMVGRAEPFHCTTAVEVKLLPVTFTVAAPEPATAVFGDIALMVGRMAEPCGMAISGALKTLTGTSPSDVKWLGTKLIVSVGVPNPEGLAMSTPMAGKFPSSPVLGEDAVVIGRSKASAPLTLVSYTAVHCTGPLQEPPLCNASVRPVEPPTWISAGNFTVI